MAAFEVLRGLVATVKLLQEASKERVNRARDQFVNTCKVPLCRPPERTGGHSVGGDAELPKMSR